MLIRMHTVSWQWMSLISYVHVYTLTRIFYTLTHTHRYRRSRKRTNIHASKYFFANSHKHVSTPTHIPALMHSCTHTRTHKHTHTCTHAKALKRTCVRMLTRTRTFKTKMHSQTLRTYTHKYTHTLTQAHEYASAHKIYRPTPKHTLCIHIYKCARTPINNPY